MKYQLEKWTSLASHFIGEHFDNCKALLDKDYDGLHPQVRFVSTQLYLSCHFSSESSLILLREGREWDADIISRSVIEGTVKYIYMLQGNDGEKLTRSIEYWERLPNYAAIKRSSRAESFLLDIEESDSLEWQAIRDLVLSDSEIEAYRAGSNTKERKLLEQKWSFSQIIKNYANDSEEGLEYLAHLAHDYGMSSHLIHKDGDGVGMIWERSQREAERLNAVKIAHIAKSISDLCTFSEIRSIYLHKSCNLDYSFVRALKDSYHALFLELQQATESFVEKEYGTET
ncbi:DUF5677 domain-containing protein [Pontibacterium granulatum]|uniref:DUF5677 domain-containing protein n=1 Tax=Pontibacterium granulatum TaxID=2036029 RepID=UPI00249AD85F|nr:DUF5677 domain-containing protein [Pontibacterium granulatum]MDI3325395.1 DUF5677 domain-containing protein [Pontibacterium granulatum]